MSEWREMRLGALVDAAGGHIKTGPFGSQLHSHEYTTDPGGIAVVMPRDMVRGRVDRRSVSRVDRETAERLKAHRLAAGDVVLARRGDVGRSAFVEEDEAGWLCGTGSMRVHAPDHEVIVPRFLRYAFDEPRVAEWLIGQSVGSTMPNLNAKIVSDLPLRVPDPTTQRRIAAVLSAFDELIEINERRIELLEDLARSLYREWFVRFRFPGHRDADFAESGIGPIPEDWEVCSLGDIAAVQRRTVTPAREDGIEFEHFSIPAFDSSGLPRFELGAAIRSHKQMVDRQCVLLSKINPRIERIWFAEPSTDRAVASTEFLAFTGSGVSNAWLWATFTSEGFQRWLRGVAGGTSTSHQRVKPGDVMAHAVPLANRELLDLFDGFSAPALREVTALRQSNRALTATRDLLLPRLVTGRLDISDIDLGELLPSEAA